MSDRNVRPPRLRADAVRGIVFDLDGTLIDSYAAIAGALNAAREDAGLDRLADDEVRRRVGRGLEALMEEQLGPGRVERGVAVFREHYAGHWEEGTHVLPGVRDTLLRLRDAGLRASVASNKPARFGRAILERLDLFALFDAVQGPDVAGSTKPDPGMIRLCLEEMRVSVSAGLYVGDMVLDVESAARAGLPVLLVPGGSSDRIALEATGERVLDRFAALCDVLLQSNRGDSR